MRKNKVILINPYFDAADVGTPNIGLVYIASRLKELGYEVCLFDERYIEKVEILNYFAENEQDILCVGLSVMTVQLTRAYEISKEIKKTYKSIPVIWGGIHPSLYPTQVVANQYVDIVVYGEGIETIGEVVDVLSSCGKIDEIAGVCYKIDNQIITNKPRDLIPFDDFPIIDWSLVSVERMMSNYRLPWLKKTTRIWHMNFTIGCPFRCTFCVVSSIPGAHKFRKKSLSRVEQEMKEIKEEYGVEYIRVRDDNFFLDITYAKDVAAILNKFGLKWGAQCRANHFGRTITIPTLQYFKENGLIRVGIGAESGSPRILKIIKKGITVDDILLSAEYLKKFDIYLSYSFIFGFPYEYIDDIDETVNLVYKIREINDCSQFSFMVLRPIPGGELFGNLVENGYREPESLEDWVKLSINFRTAISAKDITWLDDTRKKYILGLSDYLPGAISNLNKRDSIFTKFYKRISQFRVNHRFFAFKFERRLYTLMRRMGVLKGDYYLT